MTRLAPSASTRSPGWKRYYRTTVDGRWEVAATTTLIDEGLYEISAEITRGGRGHGLASARLERSSASHEAEGTWQAYGPDGEQLRLGRPGAASSRRRRCLSAARKAAIARAIARARGEA